MWPSYTIVSNDSYTVMEKNIFSFYGANAWLPRLKALKLASTISNKRVFGLLYFHTHIFAEKLSALSGREPCVGW